jgi:hypothetical protein
MKNWVFVFIAAFGLAVSSAQSNLTISGKILARSGSSLENTAVIACLIVNDDCDETGSQLVQPAGNGSSLAYQIPNLAAQDYLMLAWRDVNGSQEIDQGDELGVYQKSGKAAKVRPPATGIDLRLALFNGDITSILEQADTAPASTPQPSAQTSSSTTPSSSSLGGLTAIDCGKKERFYGDYGCIIPAVDSYLGNTKCPIEAKFPGVRQEKGFFTGYVYDSCNRPMVNVEISAHRQYGATNTTKTDSKGFYRVESQYIVGAFVYATIKVKSAGNEYSLTVYPEDRIYGNDGGIQNIQYDTRDSQLWFYTNFYGFDVPEKPLIEFILELIKLLDGTTGKPQVFRYQDQGGAIKFTGVKYGQYNISAFLITPKGRIKTWLESKNGGKLEKITVTIIGTDVVQPSIYLSATGNP